MSQISVLKSFLKIMQKAQKQQIKQHNMYILTLAHPIPHETSPTCKSSVNPLLPPFGVIIIGPPESPTHVSSSTTSDPSPRSPSSSMAHIILSVNRLSYLTKSPVPITPSFARHTSFGTYSSCASNSDMPVKGGNRMKCKFFLCYIKVEQVNRPGWTHTVCILIFESRI